MKWCKQPKPKFRHHLSLFFSPSDETIRFEPFFKLMLNYDLKVVDMTIYRASQYVGEERDHITFVVEGTIDELNKFEDDCLVAKGWTQFGEDHII